jgi:hypothetical protein
MALIEQGQVCMQTLAAFRAYEDSDVRRDRHDGRLKFETHTPATGEPFWVVISKNKESVKF